MNQLQQLTEPFDASEIRRKPGQAGGDYIPHALVTERVLTVLGPYNIEHVDLIRGFAPEETINRGKKNETKLPARDNVVVGAIVRVRCTIDGQEVNITEVGDVENPLQKANDGARAKDAISDGIKRAFARLGVGLHLKGANAHTALAAGQDQAERAAPAKAASAEGYLDKGQVVRINRTLTELGLKDADRDLKLRLLGYLTGEEYASSKEVPAKHFELLRDELDRLKNALEGTPHNILTGFLTQAMDDGLSLSATGGLKKELAAYRKKLEAEAAKEPPKASEEGDELDWAIPESKGDESEVAKAKGKGKLNMPPIKEDEAKDEFVF